jgi:hypothetical protein
METQTEKLDRVVSPQPKLPSESQADEQYFIGYGSIVSIRKSDVEKLREAIERLGGKVVFQTTTPAPLYVFRHYQVEQILRGDISWLKEIHDRKSKERRVRLEK